jgi:hypothetical protein
MARSNPMFSSMTVDFPTNPTNLTSSYIIPKAALFSANASTLLPPLDDIDPCFKETYNEACHGERFHKELDLSHLDPPVRKQACKLLQKYWSVFDDKGLFIPVMDYKCSINTGSARPICVKKINYGPQEIPIMKCCIASLKKLGHIHQIHSGKWMFKALLTLKPHQEHVHHIDDFV